MGSGDPLGFAELVGVQASAIAARGFIAIQLGFPGAQDAGHRVAGRVALLQRPRHGLFGRITVRQGLPADRSVVFEQVHDAPVGHRAHRDAGHFLQRRLVVERRVE